MKKFLFIVAMMLCCATTIFAQNNKISYQAVVRDTENKLVANKDVTVTVKIFDGDAQQPAYTQTYESVHANLNGLISLQIGPAQPNEAWNGIHWNNARIETTVTLDGESTPLGTLAMPLTAVPYAFYADNAHYADSVNVNVIANFMADQHYITSNEVAGTIHDSITDNISEQIHDSIQNALEGYEIQDCGQIRECVASDFAAVYTKVHGDSLALAGQITTLANSTTTRMNIISDSVKTNTTAIAANTTAIGGKADTGNVYTRTIIDNKLALKANSADLATVATSGSYKNLTDTPTNVAYTNASNIFIGDNTFSGSSTFSGDITITANSVSVTCGDTPQNLCTLLNELYNEITELKNDKVTMNKRIDTLKNRADSLKNFADSLADVMKAMVLYVPQEQKTVIIQAGEDQTENTYIIPFNFGDRKPNPNSAIWMYINGVMVGGNHNNVIKVTTDSVSGDKVLTYDATNNGGYKLKKDDKVTVVYWISPAND
jgi:hypothetical protein